MQLRSLTRTGGGPNNQDKSVIYGWKNSLDIVTSAGPVTTLLWMSLSTTPRYFQAACTGEIDWTGFVAENIIAQRLKGRFENNNERAWRQYWHFDETATTSQIAHDLVNPCQCKRLMRRPHQHTNIIERRGLSQIAAGCREVEYTHQAPALEKLGTQTRWQQNPNP